LKKIFQIEPSLDIAEKNELQDVIDSGWFTEAKKTREFEQRFAKFTGSNYACAVTSGTAGLYLGLLAMNIKKNDDVIVPDLTFVASPNSIYAVGAKPILCDIEKKSLNIDIKNLEKKITKKTKAIMIVNFNGRTTNMKQILQIAKKHNLKLIEDAAHSLGCFYGNKHQGTISDLGVFSFSTPKIITTGQGGMIVTNNKTLYERCCALKDFGRKIGAKKNMKRSFEHETIGYNFKFTEFQAAIGISQMKKLPKRIIKKKKMFKKYHDLLCDIKGISFVKTDLNKITPWMIDFILDSKNKKNKLINHLEKNCIETRIFYPPIHRLKPYKDLDKNYRNSSDISDKGLWLPSSVTLENKEIDFICRKIKDFVN
jgi:perosamine synthetase